MRQALTIFVAAAAVRAVYALSLAGDPAAFMIGDSAIYWPGAEAWLESGGFNRPQPDGGYLPETERVPLYFLYLAAMRWLFGAAPLAAILGQGVLDALTCVLIARLGALISPAVAWTAGLFAAVWPNMVIHGSLILTDTLFLLPLTLMLVCCAKFATSADWRWAAVAGLMCGVALMVRVVVQFLPFALIAAAVLVVLYHRKGWRAAVLAATAVAIAAVLPATPLLYRNTTQYDSWSLTSQSGTHLLYWVVPLSRGDGQSHADAAAELERTHRARLAEQDIAPETLGPFAESRQQRDLAMRELAKIPVTRLIAAWIEGAALNLASPALPQDARLRALPRPSYYGTAGESLWQRIAAYLGAGSGAFRTALLIAVTGAVVASLLQAYGFLRLARDGPWIALFAGLWILYVLGVSGPVAAPKYRLPLEPVLIPLMAIAVVDLWRRVRARASVAA